MLVERQVKWVRSPNGFLAPILFPPCELGLAPAQASICPSVKQGRPSSWLPRLHPSLVWFLGFGAPWRPPEIIRSGLRSGGSHLGRGVLRNLHPRLRGGRRGQGLHSNGVPLTPTFRTWGGEGHSGIPNRKGGSFRWGNQGTELSLTGEQLMCLQLEPGSGQSVFLFHIQVSSPACVPLGPHDPCFPLSSLPSYHKSIMYLLYTHNYFISQNENTSHVLVLWVLTSS